MDYYYALTLGWHIEGEAKVVQTNTGYVVSTVPQHHERSFRGVIHIPTEYTKTVNKYQYMIQSVLRENVEIPDVYTVLYHHLEPNEPVS